MKHLIPFLALLPFLSACSKENVPEPEMVNISFQNFENLTDSDSKILIVITSSDNAFLESFEVNPGKTLASEKEYPSNELINIHLLVAEEFSSGLLDNSIRITSYLDVAPKDFIYYSQLLELSEKGTITIHNAETPVFDHYLTSNLRNKDRGSLYIDKLWEGERPVYSSNYTYLLNSWDYNGTVFFDLNGPIAAGESITTHAVSNARASTSFIKATVDFKEPVQIHQTPYISQEITLDGQNLRPLYKCIPESPANQVFTIARMPFSEASDRIDIILYPMHDQYPDYFFRNSYYQVSHDIEINQLGSMVLPNHSFNRTSKQFDFEINGITDYVSTGVGYFDPSNSMRWNWYAYGSENSQFTFPDFPEAVLNNHPEFAFPTDKIAEMEYSIMAGDYSCFDGYDDYQRKLFTRLERGPIQEDYYYYLTSSISGNLSSLGGKWKKANKNMPQDYFDY